MHASILPIEELRRRLTVEFPETFNDQSGLVILKIRHGGCLMRQDFQSSSLRPGGTISGPAIMALADVSMYIAILASIGWVPLAVTTSLNINFLKKPAPGALTAECRILKLGKRLAVGDVAIQSEGEDGMVAHATSTYSIPPQ